ncbi:MAG: hypothetical protein ACFFDU_01185 [Candidatus Thorarchaeota archaeon]
MTSISSLIGSLQKNRADIEELTASTQRELSAILVQMTQLQETTAHLQETWEERQVTEEEMARESSALEGELSAESRERGKLESTSVAQQKVLGEAKVEREKLQEELTATETKLEAMEDEIRNIDRTLREMAKNMEKVDEQLSSSDERIAEKMQALDEQITEVSNEAELQDAQYKALRYLVEQGVIAMPEAKVAMELKGKETTTLDHLQKTTFIGRFKVREIIQQMAERKIVNLDKGTGQVKVLKPIDL